ncbi:LexA family protein [Deinococcus pimensis]|uniref:LexA family protein n=1 Tax=Deinococcus pimensis TaxID=309888 RepID=UPI00146FBA38|nr:S24 family peptidase [Deinococcus pimensis]
MPVYGVVSAGTPSGPSGFDRTDRLYLPIPRELDRPGLEIYQVTGHSMDDGTERGIRDGEYVLVDRHDLFTRYDKVYAWIDPWNELIAKRLGLYHGRRALLSNNRDYDPITNIRDYRMLGRIYAVYTDDTHLRRV